MGNCKWQDNKIAGALQGACTLAMHVWTSMWAVNGPPPGNFWNLGALRGLLVVSGHESNIARSHLADQTSNDASPYSRSHVFGPPRTYVRTWADMICYSAIVPSSRLVSHPGPSPTGLASECLRCRLAALYSSSVSLFLHRLATLAHDKYSL